MAGQSLANTLLGEDVGLPEDSPGVEPVLVRVDVWMRSTRNIAGAGVADSRDQ